MSLDLEKKYYSNQINYILGTDEAGRGPLVGPVVIAAVVFSRAYSNEEINDSKKLSDKKRRELFEVIKKNAIEYSIEIISPQIIDEINIYQASKLGMINCIKKIHHRIDLVLTDAMPIIGLDVQVEPIIKGDAKSLAIAAASILAKVTRDNIMLELDKIYPQYGFKFHKGYPTKKHLEAIKRYGIIKDIYRLSYAPVLALLNK
jgi:ribonuclease HII